MDTPTAEVINDLSRVDFEALEEPFAVPDELQPVVDQANAYVQLITSRRFDSSMPALFEPIALAAVRMRTEQIAYQAQPDYVETVNDDAVQSFSAGSYSETRTDLRNRSEHKALNTWPALNDALWMLLGLAPGEANDIVDAQREYWISLLTGAHAPAFGVTEVDWSGAYHGFGGSLSGLKWSYDDWGNVAPSPYDSWEPSI